jgi:phospholipid/cholesterol/gamma-HCH transport system substrate-binding protein
MKKYSVETVVGVFVVIGLLCVAYMTVKLGKVSLFGDNYYSLYARFSSASGLREGSPVEIDGIEVGRVARMTLDQEKQLALITMKIRNDVKIDPGGGGEILKPEGTITETTTPADIEDLISKYAFGDVKKNDNKETK